LEAIGSEVPDVISTISKMSELNIQRQLDQPFLICSSPSEVAKIFNRITKLEKIDKSVSLLTTDINSSNKNIKALNEQGQKLLSQIESLKNIDEMKDDNNRLQLLAIEYSASTKAIEDLEAMISSVKFFEANFEKYYKLKIASNDFDEIEDSCNRFDCLQSKISRLSDLIDDLNCYNEKMKTSFNEINKGLEDYEILQNLSGSYEQSLDSIEELDESIIALKLADNQIEMSKGLLKSKVDEYRLFLRTIKICPFCDKCETKLEDHDFNLFLKEFDV
jgi:predicted RNase H-like nuclease (RuvC/YqgF family)